MLFFQLKKQIFWDKFGNFVINEIKISILGGNLDAFDLSELLFLGINGIPGCRLVTLKMSGKKAINI